MIIWINGSFGSGKTSVSQELNKRIENSHIYDPEEVGFLIRDNIPKRLKKDDFQDYEIWRTFNYELLKYIHSEYKGIIIVPMTICNKSYMQEIVDKLRMSGIHLEHYTLLASEEILKKRLEKRGDMNNSWIESRIGKCLEAFEDHYFEGKIETDFLTIKEVAKKIIEDCGLN